MAGSFRYNIPRHGILRDRPWGSIFDLGGYERLWSNGVFGMSQDSTVVRLLGFAVLTLGVLAASAASAGPLEACADLQNPEKAAIACSALIDGKTVPAGFEVRVLANRAVAYGRMSRNDQAIADYSAVLKLDPHYSGAHYGRAIALQAKRDFQRAIADYNQAIAELDASDPKISKAFNGRGSTYALMGRNKRAIADFTEVIALVPDLAGPHQERGMVYLARKQYDEAIADFSAALKIGPPVPEAYLGRADAMLANTDFDGAIADYSAVIAKNDKAAVALRGRAKALWKLGRAADALIDIEKATSLEPADKAGQKLLARIKRAVAKAAKTKA